MVQKVMRGCSRGKETQAMCRQYACILIQTNQLLKVLFFETIRGWVLDDEGGINVYIVSCDHDVVLMLNKEKMLFHKDNY